MLETELLVLETQLLVPETQLVDSQTTSPTNSIEPSLEPPIAPSSRTHKGRKRRVMTVNSTTNKI